MAMEGNKDDKININTLTLVELYFMIQGREAPLDRQYPLPLPLDTDLMAAVSSRLPVLLEPSSPSAADQGETPEIRLLLYTT